MAQIDAHLTTGLASLDRMLKGIIPGDNVVWLVNAIGDYEAFLQPYCDTAIRSGRPVIYFRFAAHGPLLPEQPGLTIHSLDPREGFETFTWQIHRIIERAGRGAFYIFDCLSDLAVDWHSDQMLANFFVLTCPYLLDIEAVAYFALRRNIHATHAIDLIRDTAQVLLNVYRHNGTLYLQPLKVQQRHSPTMHMLHAFRNDDFVPISDSGTITEVINTAPWLNFGPTDQRTGVWNRTFLEAAHALAPKEAGQHDAAYMHQLLVQMLRRAISRDERVVRLLETYVTPADVLEVARRMIGTGLIGGKSVGMLLARAILRQADPRWQDLLEPHDSFYIGSDVFYTFLVRNGMWWTRQRQRDPNRFLENAETARQGMLQGRFPEFIEQQLGNMLDYFGQSPFIVRSSSLLEDNFGNAFAGKYESVFCANQGPRDKRLEDLLSAIRMIYACSMSEKALRYRAHRGLLDQDEQMALLVQRVSGSLHGELFYPHVAGVGLSFNPYVWSREIDPMAGMLRLVFGLGTRAVDRSDDDYTRVVALNAPQRRPETNFDEVRQYSQRKVDVLDMDANQLVPIAFRTITAMASELPLDLLARCEDGPGPASERNPVLTFDGLFTQTPFLNDMSDILATLQEAYSYPVDIEFTANFTPGGHYRINLLQCRPLQVKGSGSAASPAPQVAADKLLLRAEGAVIGQTTFGAIDRLIYVVPGVYGALPIGDRHEIARTIGRLTRLRPQPATVLLLGPGRWGTTTPSLGVPVTFADISTVAILCEIVAMRDDLIPDVSLGTHFFNEIVEMDMLYLALFPTRQGNVLNQPLLESAPNRLETLLPSAARWAECIRVIDAADLSLNHHVRLHANTLQQEVLVYLSESP